MSLEKKFKKIKEIGNGSQGTVGLFEDIRLGRKVAIKSLHPQLVNSVINKGRFKEEAKLLAQLNHPNIITLYDYFDDHTLHLILEFAEGIPLDKYVKSNGAIQESRAIRIFIKILNAVDYAHEKNILHRDIKPANIMIDAEDGVKIIDFGIGKNEKSDPNLTTVGGIVGGTPRYMTPEHILEKPLTKKSDIYSLGVTFWEIITGKKPFYDVNNTHDIQEKIKNEKLPDISLLNKKTSKRINDILQKATSKKAKERYSSCKAFIRQLEDCLGVEKTQKNRDNRIDVKVFGALDPVIVINDKGVVGNDFSYYAFSGEKVKLTIEKKGFQKYFKQFVSNENKKQYVVELKKDNNIILKLLLVFFFALSLFLMVLLIFSLI